MRKETALQIYSIIATCNRALVHPVSATCCTCSTYLNKPHTDGYDIFICLLYCMLCLYTKCANRYLGHPLLHSHVAWNNTITTKVSRFVWVTNLWDGMLVLLTCLVVCTAVQLSVYILCRWTENFEMRSGLGLVFSVAGNSG